MQEDGLYSVDTGQNTIMGPTQVVNFALLARCHSIYAPYPILGWTWQDTGDYGAGFYHTDGSFKSGVYPPNVSDVMFIQLTPENVGSDTVFNWKFFSTTAAAYAYYGLTPPPPAWVANTAYALNDIICPNGWQNFRSIQAGTSALWPPAWRQDLPVFDNDVIWEYVAS